MKSVIIANGIGLWGWMLRDDMNETVALSGQAFSTSELAQQNLIAFVTELARNQHAHLLVEIVCSPPSHACYI